MGEPARKKQNFVVDFSARQQAINKLIGQLPNGRRYPRRRYRSPDGYPDHLFVHRLKEITKHYADSNSPNEIYDLCGAVHAEMQGLTIEPFYLTSELLEFFINTDLPSTSSRYQESCPILEVLIPHGLIQDEDGDPIVVLIVVDYAFLEQMTDVRYGAKPDIPMPLYSIIALTEYGSLLHTPIFQDADLNPCADGEGVLFGGQVSDVLQ